MSTSANTPKKYATDSLKPRERLLQAADRLFYEEGIHAVGIDKVIAQAGVAKATLYSNFPSKDDLVVAVLAYREAQVGQFFSQAITRHSKKGFSKIEAFFAALKDWMQEPGFRGCAFINATVELADREHAGRLYCRQQKARFKEMIQVFLVEAVGQDDAKLLSAISLLVEGAIVTAQLDGTSKSSDVARETAMALISLHRNS